MDLIGNLMRENDEQFENDVYDALNEVVRALEVNERAEEFYSSINGYVTSYVQQESFSKFSQGQPFTFDPLPAGAIGLRRLGGNAKQMWDEFLLNPGLSAIYKQGAIDRPLEERVKADFLDAMIRKAFENRGINAQENSYQYHYGVYAAAKHSFVIVDGHYVVEDSQPREVLADFQNRNLYNPDFKLILFPNEKPEPGELRVFFPNRRRIIWSSLWQNFVALVLFTGVILFSFLYTLNVVFRQKKVSEMKTDFINNMTHEFKTPIATISLAVDSINSPMISASPDKVKRFANIIKQENKRMNSQVEKVLQMALLDKNDFSLKWGEVNLHEAIQRAVENISLQVEKKDGLVTADLQATNPIVEGDQTHISNIIHNLLDNANKYSPDQPEISVITRNVPNGVEVIISDKGIGMSKEARKHIFDKFYRVHTGNRHDVKGFGLGLSYVKAMMTAHKGIVDVRSELGKGSSFILQFPFRQKT